MRSVVGLRRNTVEVVAHRPEWLEIGEKERLDVLSVAGSLITDVQHVGSTSVPGLSAKPIIDLVAAVENLDMISDFAARLEELGYEYRGDSGEQGGHLLVKESSPGVRTVHLHVVRYDDMQWNNYIKFRDHLRGSDSARKEYSELKQLLAKRFVGDRVSYTNAKDEFIKQLLSR